MGTQTWSLPGRARGTEGLGRRPKTRVYAQSWLFHLKDNLLFKDYARWLKKKKSLCSQWCGCWTLMEGGAGDDQEAAANLHGSRLNELYAVCPPSSPLSWAPCRLTSFSPLFSLGLGGMPAVLADLTRITFLLRTCPQTCPPSGTLVVSSVIPKTSLSSPAPGFSLRLRKLFRTFQYL